MLKPMCALVRHLEILENFIINVLMVISVGGINQGVISHRSDTAFEYSERPHRHLPQATSPSSSARNLTVQELEQQIAELSSVVKHLLIFFFFLGSEFLVFVRTSLMKVCMMFFYGFGMNCVGFINFFVKVMRFHIDKLFQ